MPHGMWVHIVSVLVVYLSEIEALRCMSCLGIIEPRYCVQTKECAAGEQCYTEQVIDDDLNVFYNTGCKEDALCSVSTSDGFGKRSGQLHVCEKCCNAEKCNVDSCSHTNATGGHLCYKCSDVARPSDCTSEAECRVGEMCFTQEFVNDRYEKRFRLGCETIKKCELLEQLLPHTRSTQLCNMCCSNTRCNKHLCEDTHSGIGIGVVPTFGSLSKSTQSLTQQILSTTHQKATTQSTIKAIPTTTKAPPTTTKAPTTTTSVPCVDSTLINCRDLNATGTLCENMSLAAEKYCPKFCKRC